MDKRYDFKYTRHGIWVICTLLGMSLAFLIIDRMFLIVDFERFLGVSILGVNGETILTGILMLIIVLLCMMLFEPLANTSGFGILHESYVELNLNSKEYIIEYRNIKWVKYNMSLAPNGTHWEISIAEGRNIEITPPKLNKSNLILCSFMTDLKEKVKEVQDVRSGRK